MRKNIFQSALIIIILTAFTPSTLRAQTHRCALSTGQTDTNKKRDISTDDLLRLKDFGSLLTSISTDPFQVAPDGSLLALHLRRADAVADSYCTAIVLVPTHGHGQPTVIDDGGEILPFSGYRFGVGQPPLGVPKDELLRWSPSGNALAYIKIFADRSEIWRYDLGKRSSQKLLTSPVDIDALAWSDDGRAILYSSRPGTIDALAAITIEGRSGYHYDGRFVPYASDQPFVSSDIPLRNFAIDPNSGEPVAMQPAPENLLYPSSAWPKGTIAFATSAGGANAAFSYTSGKLYHEKPQLKATIADRAFDCQQPSCSNVQGLWWSPDGKTLWYERRAGIADSVTEFYAWRPGRAAPSLLLSTQDAIFGCRLVQVELVCAHEGSTSPRSIVAISLRDGTRRSVFEPNPEFALLALGTVKRLEWTNSFGISTFGDLVLPPNRKDNRRLPLVVVQYDSRGFLRGGTADEYPIQVLATHGFAVLSFNRPPRYGNTLPVTNEQEYMQANNKGWMDRRSNVSSFETIIQRLTNEGIIDPRRVAITGQSDGASTATYALANSTLFSAAILSTCCQADTMLAFGGEGLADFYIQGGYPVSRYFDQSFWRDGMLESAVKARPVPLLIQASSVEFRLGLTTYSELRHRGWPIDMYVYPDEGHVKLHPAHRSAVYRRNVQWLEFWLNDEEEPDPVNQSQYDHWKNLKAKYSTP
ncbi:Atxe2 family lasso peptide isopeptidase [Sphingomonas sp.]|uniref:Atxe2 family lasso peptide isopeptidase n=1 Tax=Sphingomonas sp. TaxID=28214 RepID=UPI0025D59609|nr:Atxe2 family lasso peptide isopeptidase [Sphingomonas sp.]